MENINYYLDLAILKSNLKNDSELAKKIGVSRSMISSVRAGRMKISHQNFTGLVNLCGMNKNESLVLIMQDMLERKPKVHPKLIQYLEMSIQRLQKS